MSLHVLMLEIGQSKVDVYLCHYYLFFENFKIRTIEKKMKKQVLVDT